MPTTRFHLFSTAGNTTLFVDRAGSQLYAMSIAQCEQAAYADAQKGVAVMAGNEFCVNACLAFGALQACENIMPGKLSMLDKEVRLSVNGAMPHWQVDASFDCKDAHIEERNKYPVICMPGISHALIQTAKFPAEADALGAGKYIVEKLHMEDEAACGVIWWHKCDNGYAIMPLVFVPLAQTCNLEKACGSGSIALALYLGKGEYSIKQPSGGILRLCHKEDFMTVGAPVKLIARGEMWLP